jgi:uncharacterized protein (TIGR00290 family)
MTVNTTLDAAGERAVLAWSGGKDCALALWKLRATGTEVCALMTTVTESAGRVSMHRVRRELVELQAAAVGLRLVEVRVPPWPSNEVYETRMAEALIRSGLRGVSALAFGDLFLEEIRAYRETQLAGTGWRALFPVWGMSTPRLAAEFIEAGFEATVVCVDPGQLDPSFVGRRFDEALLADLPAGVDPCGENGEFHTFVHGGPIFSDRIRVRGGEVSERDGFVYLDLVSA